MLLSRLECGCFCAYETLDDVSTERDSPDASIISKKDRDASSRCFYINETSDRIETAPLLFVDIYIYV